jgi:hypothetical protein
MRIFSLILFSTSFASLISAQEQTLTDTTDYREDMQWEKILETTLQADENSTAAEEAAQIVDHPLNLNTASIEELHRIPAISNLIASRIIDRRRRGRFASLDDLLEIDGITPELLSFIRPYLRIGRLKKGQNINVSFLNRTSTEMEERRGFSNGSYPGSPAKVLNRLHLSIGRESSPLSSMSTELEIGILTKKDPGEQRLTDFSTAYAGISVPSLGAHFIIGDYQMEAAEGLIFWRSTAFGKGSDVIAPARKNGGGIHPYNSSGENSFFRGIGASMELEKVGFQVLYSNKTLHANLDSFGCISSIDKSGLFRTESELQKRNASREELIGCRAAAYLSDGLKMGCTLYRTRFANPLTYTGKKGVGASELWMRGIDASYTGRNVDVFTECCLDRANALALIAGATFEPAAELAWTIVAREYPSVFQSVHGNAFGESSGQVQNESGVYFGIRAQPMRGLCISAYFDQFEHSQPTYQLPAPSHGNDFLALAECSLTNQFEIAFRFKRKDMPTVMDENDLYGRSLKGMNSHLQQNYRLTGDFTSSPSLRLSSRVEWVKINFVGMQASENGVLISQAVKWKIYHPLTVQARIAVFETDSYDSAVYEFEDEVPGAYSNPALFGRGIRWYLILRYQVFSKIDIAAKYVLTVKEGVKSIGTGLDEITGNNQSVVTTQVEIRY